MRPSSPLHRDILNGRGYPRGVSHPLGKRTIQLSKLDPCIVTTLGNSVTTHLILPSAVNSIFLVVSGVQSKLSRLRETVDPLTPWSEQKAELFKVTEQSSQALFSSIDPAMVASSRLHRAVTSFLASIRTIFRAKTPTCQQGLSLPTLPVEILQYIRDILPLSSAVALTISSRNMLHLLGSESLHSLRAKHQATEKKRFLVAMEKDLPDWQLCHPCSLFHPVDSQKGPNSVWYYTHEPKCVRANGLLCITPRFRIRYEHAQLLMNRYRFGLPFVNDLKRLSQDYELLLPDTILKSTITASIVDGGLLIQVASQLQLLSYWDIRLIKERMFLGCAYVCHRPQAQTMSRTILCNMSHINGSSCTECSKWKSCPECSSSFIVEMRQDSYTSVHMSVQKWLGSCKTPFDQDWRRHCAEWATR